MDEQRAVQVRITGRVQGVSFRVWTRDEALRLGLTGWVRNDHDGAVTALIVGPDPAVRDMLEQFWTGPSFASVAKVESETVVLPDGLSGFHITR